MKIIRYQMAVLLGVGALLMLPALVGAQTCPDPHALGSDVLVSDAASGKEQVTMVWSGSEYGVAWVDNRFNNQEIMFTVLSPDGAKLLDEIRFTNDKQDSIRVKIVWTGSEYALLWEDNRDGNFELYFGRATAAGAKIGNKDTRITFDPGNSGTSQLLWDGSEYSVFWYDNRDGANQLYFTRISAAGVKIGGDQRLTTTLGANDASSVVWTGSEYNLIWPDGRDGVTQVYFARLAPDGTPLAGDARVTYYMGEAHYGRLAYTGTEYGMTFAATTGLPYRNNFFMRITLDGQAASAAKQLTSCSYPAPLCSSTSGASIRWIGDEYHMGNLARLAADGSTISENSTGFTISPAALTWTGSEYGALEISNDGAYLNSIYFDRMTCGDDDFDGMPSEWEALHPCMDPGVDDADLDYDSDGLINLDEYLNDTDPCLADTDGDGLSDGDEVHLYGTEPVVADTDGDGLGDGDEVLVYLTDPLSTDTDGDSLNDGVEVTLFNTNPLNPDTDADGMSDDWEVAYITCVDPVVGDSLANPDGDAFTNLEEFNSGGDPCISFQCSDGIDNDGDGYTDYPDDIGCDDGSDNDEFSAYACDDGIDNDNDGFTDFPDDPDCLDATGNNEGFIPRKVASWTGSTINDLYLVGNYLYAASSYNHGLQIFDVTNPTSVATLGQWTGTAPSMGIFVQGDLAYLANEISGLQILDVSNPSLPVWIGKYTSGTNRCWGVCADGNYAYWAGRYGGFRSLDVTDPTAPVVAGTYLSGVPSYYVRKSGNYLYVAEGLYGLHILNASNPVSLTLAGSLPSGDLTRSVFVYGTRAYMADSTAGFKIVNVANPTAPAIIGQYDTPGSAYQVNVVGTTAYVADFDQGLEIFDIADAANPRMITSAPTNGNALTVRIKDDYAFVGTSNGLEVYSLIPDTDNDGLSNEYEMAHPCLDFRNFDSSWDQDADWINSLQEANIYGTDPCNPDTDNDGAIEGQEIMYSGTDPLDPDTDDDGMMDGWEISYDTCVNPLIADADQDPDGDTRVNLTEYNDGSDPCVLDCLDQDGDSYGPSCAAGPDCDDSDPDNWTSCATCVSLDGDAGFVGCDAYVVRQGPDCDDTDPDNWTACAACQDNDGDGWHDGCDAYVVRQGPDCDDSDPDNWVSCGSCLDQDADAWFAGCDAYTAHAGPDCDDSEGSIFPNAPEECDGLDNQCPGDPGFGEIDEACPPPDADGDGLSDTLEADTLGTDPYNPDSDGDGLDDGTEVLTTGTNPLDSDSDDDGVSDAAEVDDGTDPNDPLSFIGAVTHEINYQGRLTDSVGAPVNAAVNMVFTAYAVPAGGTPLWSETHTVSVQDGIYSLALGSVNPIPAAAAVLPELYLEISVEGQTMAARQKITSVLFAINADLIDGQRLETGTRSLAVIPAAAVKAVHVSFKRVFQSPPTVAVTGLNGSIGAEPFVDTRTYNVTAEGFDVEWRSLSGNPAQGNATFGYHAFGE